DAVGAAVESHGGLVTAFARQVCHAVSINIGRIGNDQVVPVVAKGGEQIALMERNTAAEPVIGNVATCDLKRIAGQIDSVDMCMPKVARGENGKTAGAGAEVEHARRP